MELVTAGNTVMKVSASYFRELVRENPLGCLTLLTALVSGSTCVAIVLLPSILLSGDQLAARTSDGPTFWITVIGSGLVFPLTLLSLAVEKRSWPGVAAIIFLFLSESILFPVMPFWTVMLLGGLSGWAALFYVAATVLSLVLLARRAVKGETLLQARM